MKVARFTLGEGEPLYGVVDGDDLVVLAGDPLYHGINPTDKRVPLDKVKLLAPVIPRSKVICVGMNYADHKKEMGHEGPENPLIFLKPNTAVVGPGDPIIIPPVEGRIVHEGELAIVIGSVAKRVKAEDWKDVVFGFTIANDVSARDVMFADGQWARAKGYDTFCPLGPFIDTEFDPFDAQIETFVD
ncbi:fumarylacetoacetate hydrolase family protein, partial [bacterium]|nr:fumarylacetoacetate hydrolase family protein [bacterium]